MGFDAREPAGTPKPGRGDSGREDAYTVLHNPHLTKRAQARPRRLPDRARALGEA